MIFPLYAFGRAMFRFFYWAMGGLEWVHEERVPKTGGLIVAPNHVSFADPPATGSATSRPVYFMAKAEMFRKPLFAFILRKVGAFPVERGTVDTNAIRQALGLLSEGRAVMIFPEGTRGDGKTLGEPSQGVALLAKRSGAAVTPVGIVGTEVLFPKGAKRLRRSRLSIIWGEPFTYEEVCDGMSDKEGRDHFGEELMRRIQALIAERGAAPSLPACGGGCPPPSTQLPP